MTDVPREDRSEDEAVDVPEHEPPIDADVIETAADDGGARAVEPTGHPAVDEVLRSLDELDGRPVDKHVAVFEQAHERLRQALSDATDDAAPPTAP